MPRRPPLKSEVQDEVIQALYEAMDDDLQDRQGWLDKRVRSIEDWLRTDDGTKDTPWEGASNITPPLIAKAVRAIHSRVLGSLWNSDPPVHVIPVNTKNREAARVREKYLNWQIRNDIKGFYRELNTAILDMIVQGTSYLMVWYERCRELLPEWRIVKKDLPDQLAQVLGRAELQKTDQEIIEELLEDVRKTEELGDHSYTVTHMDDGYEFESRVTIDWEDRAVREDEVSVTVEREVLEETLRIKNLSAESIVVPANATTTQREDCHHMARLYWLYPNQITRKWKSEEFHNLTREDIDKLEKIVNGSKNEGAPQELQQTDEVLDDYQGVNFTNGMSGTKEGKVLCVEYFYPWDVNGDLLDEDMVFHWIPCLKKLATWDYASVRYGHTRRPVIDFHFMPLTGRFYSLGLAELLADLQSESATIFNQMNDRGNLTNAPYMLVEHNAGISPNVVKNLPPGSAISVRNVDRIRPLEWAKAAGNEFPILQSVYAFAEQLSVGDISSGVQPNRPNAPRTARGTLALISESNILTDTHVLNVQFISMEELIHQIDALNQQYMPPEQEFFILGETAPTTITRDHLKDRVRFFFSGTTSNTNTQVKQQLAQIIYGTLSVNPIFTGAVVELPETIILAQYRLAEFFAREFLPGKDASFLLPPVEELLQVAVQVQEARQQGIESAKQEARDMQRAELEAGLMETVIKETSDSEQAQLKALQGSNSERSRAA